MNMKSRFTPSFSWNDTGVVQGTQGLQELAFCINDGNVDMPPAEPPETIAFHFSPDHKFIPVLVHVRPCDAGPLRINPLHSDKALVHQVYAIEGASRQSCTKHGDIQE